MKSRAAKATVCLLLAVCLLVSSVFGAADFSSDITAEAVLLINIDTGRVIYDKNSDAKIYPAGLTQIMTALVVLENCADTDAVSATADYAAFNEIYGLGAANCGLKIGESMTVTQLLYCSMLAGAADAACTLAVQFGGSIDGFVEMMNASAAKLGCTGTHFANPHGLYEDEHYTTLADMAKITEAAMQYPLFKTIYSSSRYSIPETNKSEARTIVSTVLLQDQSSAYYYQFASGVRTGNLEESGRCFATTASSGGVSYLLLIAGAPTVEEQNGAFLLAKEMFDKAFASYAMQSVTDPDTPLTGIPLRYSFEKDQLALYPADIIPTLVDSGAADAGAQYVYDLPEFVNAPVKNGDVIGSVTVLIDGVEVGSTQLICKDDIGRSGFKIMLDTVESIATSTVFIVAAIVLFVLVVAYIALTVLVNTKYKKRRRRKPPKEEE